MDRRWPIGIRLTHARRWPSRWPPRSRARPATPARTRVLLDRIVMRYPTSRYAGAARLSRSILALRQQREQDAIRDLDEVAKSGRTRRRRRAREAHPGPDRPAGRARAGGSRGSPRERRRGGGLGVRQSRLRRRVIPTSVLRPPSTPATPPAPPTYFMAWRSGAAETVAGPVRGPARSRFVSSTVTRRILPPLRCSRRSPSRRWLPIEWPTARKAYETLAARYPNAGARSELDFAEALYRTGSPAAARDRLEKVAATGSAESPRALLKLAEISEAAGDRRAALTAYDTLLRDYPRLPRQPESLLAHARLLDEFGPAYRARSLLRAIVESNRGEVAGEAAFRLGRMLSAEGQPRDAAEWYMTAASAAPGSKWEPLALLGRAMPSRRFVRASVRWPPTTSSCRTAIRACAGRPRTAPPKSFAPSSATRRRPSCTCSRRSSRRTPPPSPARWSAR